MSMMIEEDCKIRWTLAFVTSRGSDLLEELAESGQQRSVYTGDKPCLRGLKVLEGPLLLLLCIVVSSSELGEDRIQK